MNNSLWWYMIDIICSVCRIILNQLLHAQTYKSVKIQRSMFHYIDNIIIALQSIIIIIEFVSLLVGECRCRVGWSQAKKVLKPNLSLWGLDYRPDYSSNNEIDCSLYWYDHRRTCCCCCQQVNWWKNISGKH